MSKYNCECGSVMDDIKYVRLQHLRSKKHQRYTGIFNINNCYGCNTQLHKDNMYCKNKCHDCKFNEETSKKEDQIYNLFGVRPIMFKLN